MAIGQIAGQARIDYASGSVQNLRISIVKMENRTLDTSGLVCPIPILKAKKALGEMSAGSMLKVVATDPASPKDFIAFCKASGNSLLESGSTDGQFWFLIQRGDRI